MKVLVVTSDVTYVPQNQQILFEELFARAASHIAGLVVLKVVSPSLIKQIASLYLVGCTNFASCLTKNILHLPLKRRESLWESRNLPVLKTASMNDPIIISWVESNNIDLIVNIRTRCIYGENILSAPSLGSINVHHGILPKYRGVFCDLFALAENRRAGFTIHRMDRDIDSGEILFSKKVSKNNEKNYTKYLKRTSREEAKALADIINYSARHGRLPKGTPNRCSKPVFTRTPSRVEINGLLKKGMIL